jgi:hypothetical protein
LESLPIIPLWKIVLLAIIRRAKDRILIPSKLEEIVSWQDTQSGPSKVEGLKGHYKFSILTLIKPPKKAKLCPINAGEY